MSQLPGFGTERTATPLNVFWSADNAVYIPGGRTIIGADSRDPLNSDNPEVLRAGMLMGMNSTSKKMAPAIIGLLVTDTATNSTAVVVTEATGDEIERRIGASGSIKIIGPVDSDIGVVTISVSLAYDSIGVSDGTNRTITLSGNAPAVYMDGSFICDIDGTHIPISILNEPYGIKVTDVNGNSMDAEGAKLLIGGLMKTSALINFPAAALTTLRAWVKQYLRASGPGFAFDDDFGCS